MDPSSLGAGAMRNRKALMNNSRWADWGGRTRDFTNAGSVHLRLG